MNRISILRSSALIVFVLHALSARVTAEDLAPEEVGAKIYRERCASCHGASGEGVKRKYSKPLIGDQSVPQLAKYIEESMPDDAEDECVGEEAAQVARYIYDAFYSPVAQARNRPPKVELARVTVTQYRNSLADLLASFRPAVAAGKRHGLRGQYFNSRSPGRDRVVERIDSEILFDFGANNPDPKKLGTRGFAARWEGALLAPETGLYELIVRTDHAARLWVNDPGSPLIDVWVKSGSDTDFRASKFLIAGRRYPIQLDFTSRKQGVQNKGPKIKSEAAFIELRWKLPHRTDEIVPTRFLTPEVAPVVFVVSTPFPPDDRSVGYERGTSISKAWEDAATSAAIEAADYVTRHRRRLAGIGRRDPKSAAKIRKVLSRFCRAGVPKAAVGDRARALRGAAAGIFEGSGDGDEASDTPRSHVTSILVCEAARRGCGPVRRGVDVVVCPLGLDS